MVAAPLFVERGAETNCPVCGFGAAFSEPEMYDACARCGWIDDPAAYADPDRPSDGNAVSLSRAMSDWPERFIERLAGGPLSTFAITMRTDGVGGYDVVADGVPLTDLFPGAKLKIAKIGGLLHGSRDTPSGRTQLFMCHVCGDPLCGSLTADVRFFPDRVVWSRIGFESYDDEADRWELAARRDPAGFAFDLESYRRELRGLRA